MTSMRYEAIILLVAVIAISIWWFNRSRSGRQGTGRLSSRHRDLLLRFRNVVNDERARDRVFRYYQEKYPYEPIEFVLEKILYDYHADNNKVTVRRPFSR